jgi:hypothetical protein
MKLNVDTKEQEKYLKRMRQVPEIVRHAVASTLNTQAFGMRNEHIQDSLDDLFEVRSPKFFLRQTRVKMAKKGVDPNVNFALVGMMDAPRFTGLEEQQEGKAPKKKRTATIDVARGGSFAKKQRPGTRMKRGSYRRQSQYSGKTIRDRMSQMFKETKKRKLNFILRRGGANQFGMAGGLYGWRGGKLKMLQSFERPKVHRAKWMNRALGKLYRKQGPQIRVFEKEMMRIFKGF